MIAMHAERDTPSDPEPAPPLTKVLAVAARELERQYANAGKGYTGESHGSQLYDILGKGAFGWFRHTEDGEFFFVRAGDGTVLRVNSDQRSPFFRYCLGLVHDKDDMGLKTDARSLGPAIEQLLLILGPDNRTLFGSKWPSQRVSLFYSRFVQ